MKKDLSWVHGHSHGYVSAKAGQNMHEREIQAALRQGTRETRNMYGRKVHAAICTEHARKRGSWAHAKRKHVQGKSAVFYRVPSA